MKSTADVVMIGGGVMLFDDQSGQLAAVIDFHLITKWKTAGDSLMAALILAKSDAREILIVGAGTVGRSLVEAFRAGFPKANFTIWNRSPAGAQKFSEVTGAAVAYDLDLHHEHRSHYQGCLAAPGAAPQHDWGLPT